MSLLDTKHKKKSATLTAIIAVVILLLIFNFGMRYLDPPEEYGIAINFGTSDFGNGDIQPTEALKAAKQEITEEEIQEETTEEIVEKIVEKEEIVDEPIESPSATSETAENVITQNEIDAIAIKKQEEAKKKEAEIKAQKIKQEAAIEQKKIEDARKKAEKEKQIKAAKRKELDALMGGFSNGDGTATGGEGDDQKAGDKGKITGDPNASGYYGNGNGGSGGNYRLGNRKALTKPKPTYDCNEEGRVYVSISVDKTGRVTGAQAGIKGTTNTASCLLKRAKEAALKTKFNPDIEAPSKQIGIIIYNFSLSK